MTCIQNSFRGRRLLTTQHLLPEVSFSCSSSPFCILFDQRYKHMKNETKRNNKQKLRRTSRKLSIVAKMRSKTPTKNLSFIAHTSKVIISYGNFCVLSINYHMRPWMTKRCLNKTLSKCMTRLFSMDKQWESKPFI